MLDHKDDPTFTILGQDITLISDQLDIGRNTVAYIGEKAFYLGNQYPVLATAMLTWEDINKRELTQEEIRQVLQDNDPTKEDDNGCKKEGIEEDVQ